MVVAGQDVLDAKADKAHEPARARRAQIDRDPRRSLVEQVLDAALRRTDRGDRLVMRAEQVGPILLELETSGCARTVQSVVEECLEAGPDILNGDATLPAWRSVNADYNCPAHRLGEPLGIRSG